MKQLTMGRGSGDKEAAGAQMDSVDETEKGCWS
jgi:hypothetical protein